MTKQQKTQKNQKQRKQKSSSITVDLLDGVIMSDKILVLPVFIEDQDGVYAPQQYEDKAEFGEVIMVGSGRLLDNGTIVPPTVKIGDIVYFEKYSTKKVRNKGVDYLIIREDDCDLFIRQK